MIIKSTALILCALLAAAEEAKPRRNRYQDPFAALDHHLGHTLAFHYLWPWNELLKAAAAIDDEKQLEEPSIVSDDKTFTINLNVKRFKPEELRIKIKNRYISVHGKHEVTNGDKKFVANHFVQQFALPLGTKQEEVTAVLNENGLLKITAPKHELPPPPPEIEVPIEVIRPVPTEAEENTTEVIQEETTENKEKTVKPIEPAVTKKVEPLELELETTTHVGKIRKKDLKVSEKTTKDNEVTKLKKNTFDADNGLDYALIEPEE